MVFCRGCGKEIHETAISCPQCGAIQRVKPKESGTLWLPVPALTLGILSVLVLFDESTWDADTYAGAWIFVVLSIVLGAFGMSVQEKGKGTSTAGLVLGIIGMFGLIGRLVE